ncbi:hypothetical protein [Streptomyces sp. NBC_00876]|uniref:hypothetical protein n=1 Tax=Streptomyces sp. NBC_00876 TaxID=2975853 RepID=UPI00386F1231
MSEPSMLKPIIAMKCMVQMPQPMDTAASESQPFRRPGRPLRMDRTVQRSPSADPRQAIR